MEKITSRENAKIKYACRLASSGAFRRSEGKFLAEGRKLCPELCRGAALETLFCTEAALEKCPELAGLPGEHYLVEDHVADKLALRTAPSSSHGSDMLISRCSGAMTLTASKTCVSVWHTTTSPCSSDARVMSARGDCSSSEIGRAHV